jgi:hypothetical protein
VHTPKEQQLSHRAGIKSPYGSVKTNGYMGYQCSDLLAMPLSAARLISNIKCCVSGGIALLSLNFYLCFKRKSMNPMKLQKKSLEMEI